MTIDLRFVALATDVVENWRAGALDANACPPERHISDGDGNPCQHCLEDIAQGDPFLILAHGPFPPRRPMPRRAPSLSTPGPAPATTNPPVCRPSSGAATGC